MSDNQTKFTLPEDVRCYLRWLASNILLLKTENDAARYLVLKQVEELRRKHLASEPSAAELRDRFSNFDKKS